MPITLQIGATTKTLTAWGVRTASLHLASLADDTLALAFHPSAALTLPTWSYGDAVKVFDSAGTCRFSGTVVYPEIGTSARADTLTLNAAGPWRRLAATPYTQTTAAWKPGYYDTAIPPVWHEPELATYPASHVSLFCQAVTAGELTRGSLTPIEVLIDTLTQVAAYVQYGSCSLTAPVPVEEAYDLTLADVIRRCCRFAPDAVGWMDYTANPPAFHLGTRRSVGVNAFSAKDGRLAGLSLAPRPDLQTAGVIFRYASAEPQTTPGADWLKTVDLGTDVAGDPYTDPTRVVAHTFEIAATADEKLPIPTGLALEYYLATSPLHYAGSIELHETTLTWALGLGQRLNITDSDTALASASALVQEVEYDMVAGITRCTLGPPEHLQPTDIESLSRTLRAVTATTWPLTQGTATAQETPESAAAQAAAAAEAAATASAQAAAAAQAADAAKAAAGDAPALADTLTQRIQDKLGSFTLLPGTAFLVSTQSLSTNIHGFAEYIASTPPRLYKNFRATGSGAKLKNGVADSTWTYTGSGVAVTIANNGTVSHSGSSVFQWLSGQSGSYTYAAFTDRQQSERANLFFAGPGTTTYGETVTATKVTYADNGHTYTDANGVWSNSSGAKIENTLTSEDTDSDALARAQAATSWSGWAAFTNTLNGGAATWQTVRTTGWTTTAHAAKIKGTIRSNLWGYTCRVSIPLYRYPVDGTKPATPTSTQTWDLPLVDTLENTAAPGDPAVWVHVGVATLPEWEMPIEQGYVNEAGSPTVTLI